MAERNDTSASKGTGKLQLALIGSILMSILGIVYAVRCGVASDGGRGGGLAVALTFFMLFMGRGTAESALETVRPPVPGESKEDKEAEERAWPLNQVRNAVASMLDWSRHEKVYLTIASVQGTLVWTFGDCIARLFGAPAS